MNEYLISKLKEGRINKGLKQSDVTKYTGIKNTTLSNYENGITEPDIDTFLQLCEFYELDYAGILAEAYGLSVQGEDFKIKPSEIEHVKRYRFISEHSPDGMKVVDTVLEREYSVAKKLEEQADQIKKMNIEVSGELLPKRILAYYGKTAAAGKSFGFEDVTAGTIECPLTEESQNADYTIGVSGNSMEPTFYDGDIVYVKKNINLDVGDIGIFQKDNGIYIKEVGENGLISHNDNYKPIINGGNVICLGKVIGKVENG